VEEVNPNGEASVSLCVKHNVEFRRRELLELIA